MSIYSSGSEKQMVFSDEIDGEEFFSMADTYIPEIPIGTCWTIFNYFWKPKEL